MLVEEVVWSVANFEQAILRDLPLFGIGSEFCNFFRDKLFPSLAPVVGRDTLDSDPPRVELKVMAFYGITGTSLYGLKDRTNF